MAELPRAQPCGRPGGSEKHRIIKILQVIAACAERIGDSRHAVAAAKLLLGFEGEYAIPVRWRRFLLEGGAAGGVKIAKVAKAEPVACLAAALDRLLGAGEIAAPVAREHLAKDSLDVSETVAAGNVFAAQNCIDVFRLGFSFHRDAIEFQHGEFLLRQLRRLGADNDGNAV